jgi:hypothetical protein
VPEPDQPIPDEMVLPKFKARGYVEPAAALPFKTESEIQFEL